MAASPTATGAQKHLDHNSRPYNLFLLPCDNLVAEIAGPTPNIFSMRLEDSPPEPPSLKFNKAEGFFEHHLTRFAKPSKLRSLVRIFRNGLRCRPRKVTSTW